jgi:hypothetical protein
MTAIPAPRELDINDDEPVYPDIHVQLTGTDGNALALISEVARALKAGRVPNDQIQEFRLEALSGDYDNLIRTCTQWVTVS